VVSENSLFSPYDLEIPVTVRISRNLMFNNSMAIFKENLIVEIDSGRIIKYDFNLLPLDTLRFSNFTQNVLFRLYSPYLYATNDYLYLSVL
jgi:hypothetical protein